MTFGEGMTVLAVLTVFFAVVYAFGRNQVVRRRVACPHERTEAEIELVRRYQREDRPVRVRSCDLLPNPRRVDCDQACIRGAA